MVDHLVFVDDHVPGVRWDARYATADNFTGAPVDGYGPDRIVGTTALCAALRLARDRAAGHGLGLLLWDGYRPQRAVDAFVRWSQQPEDAPTKQRFHPRIDRRDVFEQGYLAARSAHSRGSTVDLALVDLASGEPVAMGGDFDLMDPISHHDAPGLAPTEAGHRRLLRAVMEHSGFVAYEREWWHYTLRDEPHPDTYLDIPIT